MADCQYADIESAGARFYRESPRKLKEAIDELNKRDLAFPCTKLYINGHNHAGGYTSSGPRGDRGLAGTDK